MKNVVRVSVVVWLLTFVAVKARSEDTGTLGTKNPDGSVTLTVTIPSGQSPVKFDSAKALAKAMAEHHGEAQALGAPALNNCCWVMLPSVQYLACPCPVRLRTH